MLVSQAEVRSRIEEINLSNEGYKRQVRAAAISAERRERLQAQISVMEEELAALEKIAQLGRVEEDRAKIEVIIRDRLAVLQERMAQASAGTGLRPEEYAFASGEVKALTWALGEDRLLQRMRQASSSRDAAQSSPDQFNDSITTMLIKALREGAERGTRASAAYDIGRLHIAAAVPPLVAALDDHPRVAAVALQALSAFSEEELRAAGVPDEVVRSVVGRA